MADPRLGRVLLVDDEPLMLSSLRRLLERLGFEIETESDPRVALRRVLDAPDHFDAVVTDFSMPGMTGAELAARIREVAADLPLLLITGHRADIEASDKALFGKRVLDKPVEVETLYEALRGAIDAQRVSARGEYTEAKRPG